MILGGVAHHRKISEKKSEKKIINMCIHKKVTAILWIEILWAKETFDHLIGRYPLNAEWKLVMMTQRTNLRCADRQVPEREQTYGTVAVPEPDWGADQDVVPEPPDQVEEAAHCALETGSQARPPFRARSSLPFFAIKYPAIWPCRLAVPVSDRSFRIDCPQWR